LQKRKNNFKNKSKGKNKNWTERKRKRWISKWSRKKIKSTNNLLKLKKRERLSSNRKRNKS
jgi:hypothetical protein